MVIEELSCIAYQPQLSKDATKSLAKLSKLALTDNQQYKPLHPALEPVNKRLNEIGNLAVSKETTDFNPMKPRRQLSRSRLVSKTVPRSERPIDASEMLLPAPVKKEPEEEPLEPEELKQDIVPDWDQHMANLVECSICGRKLYPHRIRKHEASCQNI